MSRTVPVVAGLILSMWTATGCGPARRAGGAREDEARMRPEGEARGPGGLQVQVSYSVLADVLHLVEEVSLWRRGMPRTYQRAFDDYFGLDKTDRALLRKFAFARSELEERHVKVRSRPTFDAPFGPAGLFPSGTASLVEQFWSRVMEAGQPAAVSRALAGVMEPADAEQVAGAIARLAPRAGELIAQHGKYADEVRTLSGMLRQPRLQELLVAMAGFAGVDPAGLRFQVHPVWAPEKAAFEAVAYGDRILVTLPEGKPVGPAHAALVVHELGRRLLARMPDEKKVMFTQRVVETAGHDPEGHFLFVEAVLDALSHGLAAPLVAAGPEQVPAWPGDAARKKLAEKLTVLLRDNLARGRPMDMAFVNRAAAAQAASIPPAPADFLTGAIVVGEDMTIEPFRSQVVRWTVWKFPPSRNYNYPRKFADNPGRSVLLLLTPRDLQSLRPRFHGVTPLLDAMRTASGFIQRHQSVFIAAPRQDRGYFFLLAAYSPEGMKKLGKAFFSLEEIPAVPVKVD